MTSLRLQLSASSLHIQLHLHLLLFNYLLTCREQLASRFELHLPFRKSPRITTLVQFHCYKKEGQKGIYQPTQMLNPMDSFIHIASELLPGPRMDFWNFILKNIEIHSWKIFWRISMVLTLWKKERLAWARKELQYHRIEPDTFSFFKDYTFR